ncbi:hypothetical protein AMTR_s00194p00041450 [Amborella trichopoda]|uniref:Uncharacterized protein n=1 Tax=Amborella trichopoda TaxID=13333 RepID=U5D056_AMBTC|nr:hypothetical protein AMTR_s00194p00041450 [Amborella trichopoda]
MDGELSDATSQVSTTPLHNLEAYDLDMLQYMAPLPPAPTLEHHGIPPEQKIFFRYLLKVTVFVRGRSFQGEASRTKIDEEKSVACEALVFINLLPNLADILSENHRENEGLQQRQTDLLAALDA